MVITDKRRSIVTMTFNVKIQLVGTLCLLLAILKGNTQVDLSSKEIINGLPVYADMTQQHKFYYAPPALSLDRDTEGKPKFSFVRMTHIAGKARGMEHWKQNSVVQFTVRQSGITRAALKEVSAKLKSRDGIGSELELRPAPIQKMEASLIYTNLDTDSTSALHSNYHDNAKQKRGALWTTKVFTIKPDKFTSQALWNAFQNGKGVLSVAYSIWTYGNNQEQSSYQFNGPEELEKVLEGITNSSNDSTDVKTEAIINAGAFPVVVDLEKWPGLLQEISFESTLSPRYGLVDVYCYDFSQNIRPDLLAKIVEFEAEGVGKGPVKTEIEFSDSNPDIYAHAVKFEYAVRLDQPLRYRVIELYQSGEVTEGPWRERNNWTEIIDISSKVDFNSTFKSEEQ